ncbi:MAG TPA: LamG-like jellyroll fold domain-containing protein, partial [Kofleriaceae bacterium]
GSSPTSAVEYIAPMARVVQLQLGVRLPDGAPSQTVRLYRGSREDALYTATADPGATLQQIVKLDVLSGERIYVTIDGGAVANAAVQLFVVGDSATFPSECVVGLGFDTAAAMTITNACSTKNLGYHDYDNDDLAVPPTLVAGPYAEEGMAGGITAPNYFKAEDPLARTGDFTLQFWMKFEGVIDSSTGGWPYSDLDLDQGGGIGIVLFTDGMTGKLDAEVTSCTNPGPLAFDNLDVTYPDDKAWHFVRVVYKGTAVSMCVDGVKLGSQAFSKPLTTTYGPRLGKNVVWTPQEPSFNGSIDDFRVISTALPCN